MRLYDFKQEIDDEKLRECADAIKLGEVVVFPTETVYGLGANALDEKAVEKIFKAKGRPIDNPLIVHISNRNMLDGLITELNDTEKKLADAFWPGPLTMILKKKDVIPDNVTCGMDTVGIRMPDNKIALGLIAESNVPIAAPSANRSGRPSGTNVQDILEELKDRVDYMIDGGHAEIGVESTVLKVVDGKVRILRPGKISPDDINALGFDVELDQHLFEEANQYEEVESPGMKHKHYAPETDAILVYSKDDMKMIQKINDIINDNPGAAICVIGFSEHKEYFRNVKFLDVGSKRSLIEVSHNIFSILRRADKLGCELCLVEGVRKEGIGMAIMNRLIRACGYNYIEIM